MTLVSLEGNIEGKDEKPTLENFIFIKIPEWEKRKNRMIIAYSMKTRTLSITEMFSLDLGMKSNTRSFCCLQLDKFYFSKRVCVVSYQGLLDLVEWKADGMYISIPERITPMMSFEHTEGLLTKAVFILSEIKKYHCKLDRLSALKFRKSFLVFLEKDSKR